jgi:hypothetical protein
MKSYYVYCLEEGGLAFIHDYEEFRKSGINVGTMTFTGIVVQAPDVATAQEVYNHPTSDKGKLFIADEPQIANVQDKLERNLEDLRLALLNSLIQSLNRQARDMNKVISRIAEQIHERSNKIISVEEVYSRMKEQALQRMSGWKYDGRN